MKKQSLSQLLLEIARAHLSGKLKASFFSNSTQIVIDCETTENAEEKAQKIYNYIISNFESIYFCHIFSDDNCEKFLITIQHASRSDFVDNQI